MGLQWSHVFSDMVRKWRSGGKMGRKWASMEPCLFRHGKTVADVREEIGDTTASMEPCLFRHGKGLEGGRSGPRTYQASMEPCLFRHGKLVFEVLERGI